MEPVGDKLKVKQKVDLDFQHVLTYSDSMTRAVQDRKHEAKEKREKEEYGETREEDRLSVTR